MRQRSIGILQAIAAGFCFGFLGFFGKWAFFLGLKPGEFLSLRFLTAAAILGSLLLFRDPSKLALARVTVMRALALGVCGYALFSSCYFAALQGLSVSLTVLLLYTYPLWVAVAAKIWLGEVPKGLQRWALPLGLVGLLLLLWGELQVRDPFSLLLGLFSGVFYAVYVLASRQWLKDAPAFSATFYVLLGAGLALGALNRPAIPVSPEPWLAILGTAVIGTIIPVSLLLTSLKKLKSSEVSMLNLVEPLVGVVIGILAFGEAFQFQQIVGGALIAMGMLFTTRANPS